MKSRIGEIRYLQHGAEMPVTFFEDVPGGKWKFTVSCGGACGAEVCRHARAIRTMAKRMRQDVQKMANDPEFLDELRQAAQEDLGT